MSGESKFDVLIGHLINPQICGVSPSEVWQMNFTEAQRIIEAVSLSNQIISKASND